MSKLLLCTIMMVLFVAVASAQEPDRDKFSLGVSGIYEKDNRFAGELYLARQLRVFRQPAEVKAGVRNRGYQLSFDGVDGLEASSFGIFGDLVFYPFAQSGFFAGVRFEGVNLNWLSEESMSRFEMARGYRPSSVYSGSCAFVQVGYRLHVSDAVRLRLYGQPGVQQFRISDGTATFGNYIDGEGLISENQYRFIYNINLGVEIRLSKN